MDRRDLVRRVALLDKMVIAHPAFDAAVRGIEECSLQSEFYSEPVGSLLLAEGGMGKTTVCRTILSRMKRSTVRDDYVDGTIVPAFYFSIPASATIRGVAESMLQALGVDDLDSGSNRGKLTRRLCKLLQKTKTTLVFADEFHHLFLLKNRSASTNEHVRNWIKEVVDQTGISFCLVGLPAFAPLLAADGQHARRFPLEYCLSALTPGDQDNPGTLVSFLAEAMQQTVTRLKLDGAPHFDSLYTASQVYAATSGVPSYVTGLIKHAALSAFSNGASRLTMEHFAAVWDSGRLARVSLVRENPFRLAPSALATAMRRHSLS
ncbi:TniB family NTP-binding protein [Duganella sp.]|uniref:TniB family NTP-binding protein n=1 Tax=Duganella sp. TaxID=1904440 RepID=UPI0031DAA709